MHESQNQLIALLPVRDQARLTKQCERVHLELNHIIFEPGEDLQHVYFPLQAFISLLAVETPDALLEVGMTGREGMLGVHTMLGVAQAPQRALVQGAGLSLRLSAAAFQAELLLSPALRLVMRRFVHVSMQQLATSALCMRFHLLGPRLARWLLMTHDRAGHDRFRVTQEFLSAMLGMRRVGVNAAAMSLQERGLIDYRRGDMHVRDRAGLEQASCSCYANNQKAYHAQLSNPIKLPK